MGDVLTNKRNWLNSNVLAAGITSFLSDMSHEAVTVLLPSLLAILNAPMYALGLIEGFSDGLASIAKVISGYYSDKFNKRKELSTFGYFATGIFPAIVALSTSWYTILFARVFGWIGRGLRGPPRDAIIANSVAKKDLGKAFGFHRFADTSGAILGPLIAVYLLSYVSIKDIILVATIPGLIACFIFFIFVKDTLKIKKFDSKTLIASLEALPNNYKLFLLAILIFGLADFSHTLLIAFAISELAVSLSFVEASTLAISLYAMRNISYAVISYPSGLLGDKLGKKKVLLLGYLIGTITFLGFIIFPKNFFTFSILFILSGAFIAFEDTLEAAAASEFLERHKRSLGLGALAAVNGIGDMVSSIAFSFISSAYGYMYGFAYSCLLSILGVLLLAYQILRTS